MKKILSLILAGIPMMLSAQVSLDAYSMSQTDLRGTARYVSMAGAFGALGGDLSAINQNPGGIGVYRSSDVGLSLSFDNQGTKTTAMGLTNSVNQFKFNCNSFGYVGAFKLDSETMPFINWGFSYNRPVSFNRRYNGTINNLSNSLSNYIATVTNNSGYTAEDLAFGDNYDPYINSYAPWLSIMAYNSYLINPVYKSPTNLSQGEEMIGLYNGNTSGFAEFETIEKGGIDEFNMNFGGNLADVLYWGVAFGISNMDYDKYTYYGEGLSNASVYTENSNEIDDNGIASYGLENWLKTTGNGWNFKLGVIFKPINEFRIGLAFHTPTYWQLTDESFATMNYYVEDSYGYAVEGYEDANAGYTSEVSYEIQTPWKFSASAAAVLGSNAILSFDYERVAYDEMKIKYENAFGDFEEDYQIQKDIKDYYKASNIYRIGAEYRVTPQFSLRLGYSYQSSPVNKNAYNGKMNIVTAGTMPSYTFDKSTQYYTGGIGYRFGGFYTDLAYIHKTKESQYRAFSPDVPTLGVAENIIDSPTAKVKDNNNQIVLTLGYRF